MGLEDQAVLLLGEIALALVLFTDAARTDLSVLRTRLAGVSVLFAGWFGPRGLASIVLGLIVVAEAPHLAGRDEIKTVVASTVLLNVLLHGITAAPLSAAYAPGRGDGRRRAGAARGVDTPGLRLYPCSR
jgi:sodium/hydrogen antiporter